jgi:hypothetical protein
MLKKIINNEYFYISVIVILAYIVIYFFVKQVTKVQYTQEGLTGQINRAIRDIGNVGNEVKRIPNKVDKAGKKVTSEVRNVSKKLDKGVNKAIDETNKITKYIDDKFNWFLGEVERQTKDIVFNKILQFFNLLGRAIKLGIIDPIMGLFIGLGNVFEIIGSIFEMIGKKILSIPACIIWYFLYSIISITYNIFHFILGDYIMSFFDKGYEYFWWPLNKFNDVFLIPYLGLDIWWLYKSIDNKCYKFPIKKKGKEMEDEFKKMGDNFKKGFGKISFKFSKN